MTAFPTGTAAAVPQAAPSDGGTVTSGWMLRFKPDEDLVEATTAFAEGQRLSSVRVVGGVGSLTRATLATADGAVVEVDGPGIEIVTLEGPLDALRMVVADLAGRTHAGRPVAGGNPICVTIELFVESGG